MISYDEEMELAKLYEEKADARVAIWRETVKGLSQMAKEAAWMSLLAVIAGTLVGFVVGYHWGWDAALEKAGWKKAEERK